MTAAATYGTRRARHYDVRARRWDATIGRAADRAIDRAIVAATQGPVTVLDVGAGTGRNLDRLRRLRRPVLAYRGEDIAPAMIAEAEARRGTGGLATFVLQDALDVVTGPQTADLVLCTWVAGHVPDPARLLSHARARVAPEGSLVVAAVTTPGQGPGDRVATMLAQMWGVVPVPAPILTGPEPCSAEAFLGGALTVTVWRPRPTRASANYRRPTVRAPGGSVDDLGRSGGLSEHHGACPGTKVCATRVPDRASGAIAAQRPGHRRRMPVVAGVPVSGVASLLTPLLPGWAGPRRRVLSPRRRARPV